MLFIPIVCALILGSQTSAPPTEVTLKFQPPVGKTYQYKMSMAMTMDAGGVVPNTDFKTDVDFDMKILSRDGDVTTIESKMGKAKVTIPDDSPLSAMKDQMEESMSGKSSQTKIDSQYKVQSATGAGADMAFSGMQNLSFPKHSLKVGETWTTDMDLGKVLSGPMTKNLPGAKATGKIPINFRLEKVTLSGGQTLAEIHIDMKGDMDLDVSGQSMAMHLDGSGSFTIDVATGMTVSTKMVSSNNMAIGSMNMVQHMTQTMAIR
jgi:hypothetical protein